MVRRIQSFYRVSDPGEFGPVELNNVVVATAAQIESTLPTLRSLSNQGVRLELDLHPLPLISGNELELAQLLTNLILNALDAMPQGGQVSVRTFQDQRDAVIQVRDTGIGMAEEVRRRIFEPFYTTKGEAGTGLGLAIAKWIVQRHGGEIAAESEVGRGTMFAVAFPGLAAVTEPVRQTQGDVASAARVAVVVIDDDPRVAHTLESMLSWMGHEVWVAGSGREGLERVAKGVGDLVLVDLGMEEVDGWQVVEAALQSRPGLPVYLLTGYGVTLDPEQACQAGAAGVLGKPVSLASLADVLRRQGEGREALAPRGHARSMPGLGAGHDGTDHDVSPFPDYQATASR